ncbi:hypothetical protein SISSUDRAFT_109950 [Sistotremastrum suecicum HHB10207 ss-3]|uniref:NADH-ubiquinone oxidoreductase 12 kDa subunit n=1 Tax=Sistotremastrum suecicum HHB10207 ss-3 TaxID=1314776 RepID=A0A166GZ29_9AGAM|nr:hypothetical protein SISSUDRAFT_109950 [Sistotremastrum suecicum HHB10207 ss-3]
MNAADREAKYAELKDVLAARDHTIREQWVKAMELRLVREELEKCQQSEGVNGYENCKDFAQRYLSMLKDHRVVGYKVVDT